MATHRTSVFRRNLSVAAACALLALIPFASHDAAVFAEGNDKLTTVLADLARSVPQDQGPALQ